MRPTCAAVSAIMDREIALRFLRAEALGVVDLQGFLLGVLGLMGGDARLRRELFWRWARVARFWVAERLWYRYHRRSAPRPHNPFPPPDPPPGGLGDP